MTTLVHSGILSLVVPALLLATGYDEMAGADETPHPLHLSTTSIAVDSSVAYLRTRLFKNDLEVALAGYANREQFRLTASPPADSLFLAYFGEHFDLVLDGVTTRPRLLASGEDFETPDGDERIWWVELAYEAAAPIGELAFRSDVLYEVFDDQRNVVRVLDTLSGRQRSTYFAAPDTDWERFDTDRG